MKTKTVASIIRPYPGGLPLTPSVAIDDKIMYAIELMVTHNAKRIVVARNGRIIGMILLEDAFHALGLQQKSEGGMGKSENRRQRA
jgi:CBS domain-containing protein